MGEAKRRKLLDPNYGQPSYSHGDQLASIYVPRITLDKTDSLPTAVSEYEDCVQAIVEKQRKALFACALVLKADYPGEQLCLMVLRAPASAEHLALTFRSTTSVQTLWRQTLMRMNKSEAMDVDQLFAAARSKLKPEQFLWTHLDIDSKGVWARLVPIDDSNIAQVCNNKTPA
ncbi:MAG: hypothetical protein AAFY57_20525 [Cyanobacteria bacterium J06642_2]